ncbi:hypothetical protein N1851_033944 [Merluccius polli]|uniref:DUF5641 domain-containing protein n=1 Tax=Merluccius polli TaxID=89951 RepID=A0AA47M0I0_MERPO|nr:hypothetical protein N1851_033944 [Merluccius polli]
MDERNPISRLVEHYSSWDRLKRAVAWLLKLKGRLLLVGQERKSLMKANPGSNPTPGPTHGAECLSTFPGAKGLIRSVLVKTKSSTLQRPVDKLCLLLEAAD